MIVAELVVKELMMEGKPFQWIFASALSRIDIDLVVSDGPDSLSFPDPVADLDFTLHGSGLNVGPGGPFNGTASRVVITSLGAPGDSVDITLPTATPFADLVNSARAVPPPGPVLGLEDFNRVLMPDDSPFPDLFFTGGDGPNVALGFDGDDVFDLGGGRDTVFITPGNDQIDGGPGKDTVSGEFSDTPMDMDLDGVTVVFGKFVVTIKSVENADGTSYNDVIFGNKVGNVFKGHEGDDTLNGRAGNDTIDGGGGNDTISGGGGNDTIRGGSGDDTLKGGAGRDRIDGGGGDDTIYGQGAVNVIFGGPGKDSIYASNKGGTVKGGSGADLIVGGFGKDDLSGGTGPDEIAGGAGNDKIGGGSGNDKLSGGRGKDTVSGGTGKDKIDGGAGDDTLKGGSGNDSLEGGEGDDTLFGGAGRDTLVFRASTPGRTEGDDTVLGYEPGKDTITIVEGASDEVRVTTKGGNTIIDYGNGTITIEDQILTRGQITFEYDL